MKVLLVSLFHPELVRGGAQQVAYELFLGLQQTPGVEPSLLASIDANQAALYKSGARITGFDGRPNEFLFLSRSYDYFWHRITNPTMAEAFVEYLDLVQPDVVHFHHFLTLGVDLLTLTKVKFPKIRIVFTLHEFLVICHADGHMMRKFDRSLCMGASPVRCHQCFPDVRPEQFFLRELWMKRHLESVDVFTTPSRFMIPKFVAWGIPEAKIRHVTNGQKDYSLGVQLPPASRKRNRFGFFGQLVDIKGVFLLIEAVEYLRSQDFTDFVVEINGDNLRYASEKRRNELEAFLKAEDLKPIAERNVVFNGSYNSDQLRQRMARVDWCVVPSVWWEIFGLVISEAWMFGRPVIASNVGGPAERITDGENGLLFQLGDAISLGDTIMRACLEPELWDTLNSHIVPPTSRESMAEDFLVAYRGEEAPAPRAAPPSAAAPIKAVPPVRAAPPVMEAAPEMVASPVKASPLTTPLGPAKAAAAPVAQAMPADPAKAAPPVKDGPSGLPKPAPAVPPGASALATAPQPLAAAAPGLATVAPAVVPPPAGKPAAAAPGPAKDAPVAPSAAAKDAAPAKPAAPAAAPAPAKETVPAKEQATLVGQTSEV